MELFFLHLKLRLTGFQSYIHIKFLNTIFNVRIIFLPLINHVGKALNFWQKHFLK